MQRAAFGIGVSVSTEESVRLIRSSNFEKDEFSLGLWDERG